MSREEHLQWCKDRANEYVDAGDLQEGFNSFVTDMNKHEGTSGHIAVPLGMQLLMTGHLSSPLQMKNWINGFN